MLRNIFCFSMTRILSAIKDIQYITSSLAVLNTDIYGSGHGTAAVLLPGFAIN